MFSVCYNGINQIKNSSDILEFPYCKRNIDEETNEPEENMQFIPEQPNSMKSEEGIM